MAEPALKMAPEGDRPPGIITSPLLPVASEYSTVTRVRQAVLSHDQGEFWSGALLAERMRWNPRIWSVLQTRTNGLIATGVRWREGRPNRDGRKALAAWREDYPRMMPTAVRHQRAWDALMLGLTFAQREGEWNASTGRWLLHSRPYWAGWVSWSDFDVAYRVDVRSGLPVFVPSPAAGGKIDPLKSPWAVYEPNGAQSWRWGLLHPLWYAWFGLDRCVRDGFRWSEKHGLGIMKVFIPDGSGTEYTEARDRFVLKLQTMGGEGMIPCRREAGGEPNSGFDVQPLEFAGGAGFAGIEGTRNSTNVDIAVAGLGHNLTTEVKGGSFAAAGVGDYIRGDFKKHDVNGEIAHDTEQLGRAWALFNFGDPELAPIGDAEADPPAADQAAATTLQLISQFLATLPEEVRARVDVEALADRFRIALKTAVAVPRTLPAPDGETQASDAQAQPDGTAAQFSDKPAQGNDTMAQTAEKTKQASPLALTPTDLATVVTVDEARASVALPDVGGVEGSKWVAQHSAEIRAAAAPDAAVAAKAASGAPVPPIGAP